MRTPPDGIALPTTTEPSAPVAPRPRRRGWSLRAHLISVVLATVALVVLGTVLTTAKDYSRARQGALRDARFEAGLASDEISNMIPDLRALIVRSGISVGQATGGTVTSLPPDKCNLSFQEFRSFKSGVLHIVLPDGSVMCSSRPGLAQPGTHPYAGANWLTPVVQNGSATVVGPLRDPVSREWALFVAAPIPSPGQAPTAAPPAVLALELDLTPLAATIHDNLRKLGSVTQLELLITDAKRDRVVSRSIQPQQSSARPLPPSRYARAESPKGALIRDLNGTERLYVGSSVKELNWHVYAGISKTSVYKQARDALRDHVVVGLIIVFGVALVTLSGIFTVARR